MKDPQIELVEDDILLAEQFVLILKSAGFKVHHSRHAGEAILSIDRQMPDLCILDLLLPASSGLALLNELQSFEDSAKLPIIVCSSLASDLNLKDLKPYGVRCLLDKTTMQPSDLVAGARSLLG